MYMLFRIPHALHENNYYVVFNILYGHDKPSIPNPFYRLPLSQRVEVTEEDLPFEEPEVILIYLVFALVLERRVMNINCWRE